MGWYEDYIADMNLPWTWEICGRCRGEGKHGNPSFDGVDNDFWNDDLDFFEEYMAGRHDVLCQECHGDGKIKIADEDQMTYSQIENLEDAVQGFWEMEAEYEMERRMGA